MAAFLRHFEIRAAWALGFALPLLELARRGREFYPVASYVDDFIAGALLLWSAMASRRTRPYGRALLCASWGMVCGGLYYSFFGQIERGELPDVSGIANRYVIVVKGILLAISLFAVVLSVRHLSRQRV